MGISAGKGNDYQGDELTADFREAVRNWRSLSLEERKKYVFALREDKQEKALHSDTFPLEPADHLLERIRENRARRGQEARSKRTRGRRKPAQQLNLMEW